MATIFALHATAGKYHLETWFVDGQWGWKAIATDRRLDDFTGDADSLEGAKALAMSSIGLRTAVAWTDVGPPIDVVD
jgi:hypothetical protein